MFENDDWDIDEDYLSDFNADKITKNLENENKESQRTKQNIETKEKLPIGTSCLEFKCTAEKSSQITTTTKNAILDIFNKEHETSKQTIQVKEKLSDDTSHVEFNCSNEKNSQSNTTVTKDAILDIFKNTNTTKNDLKLSQTNNSRLHTSFHKFGQPSTSACNVTNEYKKNVVLDIFQENKTSTVQNNDFKSKPIIKSVLKITDANTESENKLKRKKNVAFSESVDKANTAKKMCISTTNELSHKPKEILNCQSNDQIASISNSENIVNKSNINDSKRQMLLDLLKSPVQKSIRQPRIKQTVVRKFPGPAGILPDDIDESEETVDLDSLDEKTNSKSNKYNDICSQNTKNMFTTGAWQLMTDDLPADFELYDIAIIKENALEYSRTYKKVPYLAGIIQHIDYKPNDPHVILKDLSGKIDARIHHSICKLYPNAIGTNTVVLVKDVGLIVTSKNYVCVIISPKNLVSIYSDEARLVETSHLEKLLDNNYKNNLNESQISLLEEIEHHEIDNKNTTKYSSEKRKVSSLESECTSKNKLNINSLTDNIHIKDKKLAKTDNLSDKILNTKKESTTNDLVDDAQDWDFNEDDSWLGVNVDDLNSFKAHEFPSSTPMDMNEENLETKTFEHEKQTDRISKTLKNFVWQKPTKTVLKKSDTTIKNSILNSSEILSDSLSNEENIKNNSKPLNVTVNNESLKSKNLSNTLKMKLSAFRCKEDLTPPPIEENVNEQIIRKEISPEPNNIIKSTKEQSSKINIENKPAVDNKLFDTSENDTDDEMLSQLDVDAIAASYNQ